MSSNASPSASTPAPVAATVSVAVPVKVPVKTPAKAAATRPVKPAARAAAKVPGQPAARRTPRAAAPAVAVAAPQASAHKAVVASPKKVKPKAVKTAKAVKTEAPRPQKIRMVRDSFTFPETEHKRLVELKKRVIGLGAEVKKGELVRAGLALLAALDNPKLLKAVAGVEKLKTGRPTK